VTIEANIGNQTGSAEDPAPMLCCTARDFDDDEISRNDSSGGTGTGGSSELAAILAHKVDGVDLRTGRSDRIRAAMNSVKGARSSNEDYHGMRIMDNYAFSFVCDGHGGATISVALGSAYMQSFLTRTSALDPDASPEVLVSTLRDTYKEAVAAVDKMGKSAGVSEGSTISVMLLQVSTMRCATLQVGDCEIYAGNAQTGELLPADVIYSVDDAEEPDIPSHAFPMCQTRPHGFGDEAEVRRYNKSLNPHGITLRPVARTDQMKGEDRYWGKVQGSSVEFNECARAVESMNMYPAAFASKRLHLLQREPEFVVWQLPSDVPLALIVCCDGFGSKRAMPSAAATFRCVCDPETYMGGEQCLNDTIMKRFATKAKYYPSGSPAWAQDATECCYNVLHQMCPDETWRQAVVTSWESIKAMRKSFGGRVPTLLENPQAATSMATDLAVLLMSDDNVSCNVLVVS